jgi:hypothetical protein
MGYLVPGYRMEEANFAAQNLNHNTRELRHSLKLKVASDLEYDR